jgi:hypothetical protein
VLAGLKAARAALDRAITLLEGSREDGWPGLSLR